MSESFQSSEKGSAAEEVIGQLEDAVSNIVAAMDNLAATRGE